MTPPTLDLCFRCLLPRSRNSLTLFALSAAFPGHLNTCGRITVDPSGQFVVVSNRGHNSIATLKVDSNSGMLKVRPSHFDVEVGTPICITLAYRPCRGLPRSSHSLPHLAAGRVLPHPRSNAPPLPV
eukprot:TRINITY_DN10264_c0_g1_i2.p4 TRINITY_DN10264_c0_g1~~TRINITY_DN10264_c0_g1_i2.p4  ORF type:complete len:127 (+),score=11.05 TRINITY_DN10264_c0_g1_i2:1066-1446(+)